MPGPVAKVPVLLAANRRAADDQLQIRVTAGDACPSSADRFVRVRLAAQRRMERPREGQPGGAFQLIVRLASEAAGNGSIEVPAGTGWFHQSVRREGTDVDVLAEQRASKPYRLTIEPATWNELQRSEPGTVLVEVPPVSGSVFPELRGSVFERDLELPLGETPTGTTPGAARVRLVAEKVEKPYTLGRGEPAAGRGRSLHTEPHRPCRRGRVRADLEPPDRPRGHLRGRDDRRRRPANRRERQPLRPQARIPDRRHRRAVRRRGAAASAVQAAGPLAGCDGADRLRPASARRHLARRQPGKRVRGKLRSRESGLLGHQAFASIHWGYEDTTVAQFERDTGLRLAAAPAGKNVFEHRFEQLAYRNRGTFETAALYDRWVAWRCEQVHAFHRRLAAILAAARPGLTLSLQLDTPSFDEILCPVWSAEGVREFRHKGWTRWLREAGLDPALYRGDQNLLLVPSRTFPPEPSSLPAGYPSDVYRELYAAREPVEACAKPVDAGILGAMHFDAASWESHPLSIRAACLDLHRLPPLGGTPDAQQQIVWAGVLQPAGRRILARFAAAMADANLVCLTDGNHSYDQGQPRAWREFLAEYHALPAIPMQRLEGSGDPVALWWGQTEEEIFFYLVNRGSHQVVVEVQTPGGGVTRLTQPSLPGASKLGRYRFRQTLEPHQLAAFRCHAGQRPWSLRTE